MTNSILVRVTTEIEVCDERATALWVVATGNPAEAARTVRERVFCGCIVLATDTPVATEMVKKLGLALGQAWHL